MDALFESWLGGARGAEIIGFIIDVSLRASVLCLIAGAVTTILRRSSAYARKMIWLFALMGLVLLPPLVLLNPVWNVPLIPAVDQWSETFSLIGDKPVETGLARAWKQIDNGSRTDRESRFEQEQTIFHEAVRSGYLELARKEADRFQIVDASLDEDHVTRSMTDRLLMLLGAD